MARTKKHILDTDTPLDFLIHRPVALTLARVFSKTPVTPNQVTIGALLFSFASSVFFALGDFSSGLTGFLFFYFWAVLDHTDGELARLTKKATDFGRRLDDACDAVASSAILLGIFFGALSESALPKGWLTVLFLPALFFNSFFGTRVVKTKHRVRTCLWKRKKVTSAFTLSQNILDHFTGREPFYLLVIFSLVCFYKKLFWPDALLVLLIAGCYGFGIGYFVTEKLLKRRF
jgi:phosphatidylglycerophosphate synthase